MSTSLLPLISIEGNTSLPVDLIADRLPFLRCDFASQSDKLSAVLEAVGVSMHRLTCQRMPRMSVNVNVVSMVRVLGSGILVTVQFSLRLVNFGHS